MQPYVCAGGVPVTARLDTLGKLCRPAAVLLGLLALCLLAAVRGGGAAHAAGITVTYPAGWNLVGGPDGTVCNAPGSSYTLGAGDTGYAVNPGSAPVAGGKGYWMYFPSET